MLALVLLNVCTTFVRADDDDAANAEAQEEPSEQDAGADSAKEGTQDRITGINTRVKFVSHDGSDLKVHAGDKVEVLVAFSNAKDNQPLTVLFAQAHLMYAGTAVSPQTDGGNYVMNFSGTMYNHVVRPSETGTFKYAFATDPQTDPRAYDLAVRLYFSTEQNASYVSTAFQGTVLMEDAKGIDYQTIGTVTAIIAAAAYFGNRYLGKTTRGRTSVPKNLVETSSGAAYDPDFVSKEHLRWVEEASARTKGKSTSPKRAPSK